MSNRPVKLVAILGSVTPAGRLRRAVAEALERIATQADITVELVDLADVQIAFADGRAPAQLGDDTAGVLGLLAEADAVLLATPVYRGSLTGSLKNLLDHVPVETLRDKPVAILAMGAGSEHFLGPERHLRDVLAFFGALVLPVAGYLVSKDFSEGAPSQEAEAQLDSLLAGLVELARALAGVEGSLGPPPLAARARRAPKSG
jgi:FMN reductase